LDFLKPPSDELTTALQALRHRPIVIESRDYARRWARERWAATPARRVLFSTIGAIAATCIVAFFAAGMPHDLSSLWENNLIETAVAQSRTVVLDDGSRVLLDAKSRLRVAFTPVDRTVELLDGQAHFDVAKDSRRPFRVRTKSAEVVVVGTLFDVATVPTRTTVTLIEGRVNVRTISERPRGESTVETLAPGQQLRIDADGRLLDKKDVRLDSVTAWQHGMLVLDDMPLREALAVVNRYSTTQIVIPDLSLQSRRISASFRSGDVETETVALERYFGLKVISRTDREIVLKGN
jgi:ferric-dicitrate binding protein FerR (iron transport regulator)